MKIYLLIEAPMNSIDDCVVDIFATYEDADKKWRELTSKRCGYHSMEPNDYYIEERELLTYCSNCNKPFSFDKNNPPSDNLCRECRNKANPASSQYVWQFPKTLERLIFGEANRNEK